MRIIRFLDANKQVCIGWVNEDRVGLISGSIYGDFHREEATIPLNRVTLLPPVAPSKVVCLGRNYPDHAREQNAELPSLPMIFLKAPSAIIGRGEKILLPPQSQQVDYEGELAVVIGKTACEVPAEQAREFILGYTIANDVTARDLQIKDSQWTRAKSFDTFLPIGPWIETDLDPFDVLINTHVNGVLRQMGSTKEMNFPVFQLVAYISTIMTLEPGDVILTGTPAGVGRIDDGDYVNISIEGIGELFNPVANRPPHRAVKR
jgi:2-keto-4-pentenoate hydratase/2-oxohepta-3-ene-1,7-dioic acid hydratase in catechol pathway